MTASTEERPKTAGTFFSKDALQSVSWVVLSKAAGFILYILTSILIVRGLGPEDYGRYGLCRNLAESLLIFCTLGLNNALTRFLPEIRVEQGRGIRRFLGRVAALRLLAFVALALIISAVQPLIARAFSLELSRYLPWILGLILALNWKEYLNNSLISLYYSKTVATLSFSQAVLWLSLCALVLYLGWSVEGVLASQVLSTLFCYSLASIYLYRQLHGDRARSHGVARRRVAILAGAMFVNQMLIRFTMQYTEVFFIGYYYSPTLVGFYDLAVTLPQTVITFIPWAIQSLFAAAFAEAYTKDKSSLFVLMRGMYQVLILASVPISAFGLLFSPMLIETVYGPAMATAGPLTAAFFLIHLLPMVSIPLAMALMAREKVQRTIWLLVLDALVNLALDLYLIPRFALWGGVAAVVGTFVLTTPLRLYIVSRLIGGIDFPFFFFLRFFGACVGAAGALWILCHSWEVLGIVLAVLAYPCILLLLLRYLPIIKRCDTETFRSVGIARLNTVLDFLSPTP